MIHESIDCHWIRQNLKTILNGSISETDILQINDHVETCEVCATLLSLSFMETDVLTPCEHSNQVEQIIALTSGDSCSDARARIFASNRFDTAENELLTVHIDNCSACRRVASTWDWIEQGLHDMSQLEPDPQLASDILHKTVHASNPSGVWDWVRDRIEALSSVLVGRRRAAWELGYLFALPVIFFFQPISIPGQFLNTSVDHVYEMTESTGENALKAAAGLGKAIDENLVNIQGTVSQFIGDSISSLGGRVQQVEQIASSVHEEMKTAMHACVEGNFDRGIRHTRAAWSVILQFELSDRSEENKQGEHNGTNSHESI